MYMREKPHKSEVPITRVTLDLPAALAIAFRKRAAELGLTVSQLVVRALEATTRKT
jgi:hypothetical protein